ncbi:MAG TPA: hypothetical protein VKD90_12960 [Gemmataceae bacterium]|nr:hypothetical protein [Gemmataceae bacterium]
MLIRWLLTPVAAIGLAAALPAADLAKVPRTIGKEPTYATKAPRYLLLAFGPEAKDRVWVVFDGDTLYVDRNGNGDLTEPGEAVPAKNRNGSDPDLDSRSFEVGDLTVGGVIHKALIVSTLPLAGLSDEVREMPDAKARLQADPKVQVARVWLEVQHPRLKGPAAGGRVPVLVGPLDVNGMLVPGRTPQDAPVIHLDGPLEVTFYSDRPIFQMGRESDAILVVGSPGLGHGTLAMLSYEDIIPEKANPVLEVTYAARGTNQPVREHFELKERC